MNKDATISFTICTKDQSISTLKQSGMWKLNHPKLDKIELEVWDGIEGVNLDLTLADLKSLKRKIKQTIIQAEELR